MNSIIIENERFCLTLSEKCIATSLIHKPTGTECINNYEDLSFFTLTEERPFNNEIKLGYPNKRTTFSANRVRREGDKLIVGFELITFEAVVALKIEKEYIAFTLEDFIIKPEDFGHLAMTPPPVAEFRLINLPIVKRDNFGQWLNVMWDDKVAINVLATSPYERIDSVGMKNCLVMTADAVKNIKLKGATAALIVSAKDEFLDCVEKIEEDYKLPHGVRSRRSDKLNSSAYWVEDINLKNVDEHISYAKMGGFKMMLVYYLAFTEGWSYTKCGDYDFKKDEYPNGIEDLKLIIKKIKDAGLIPGFHILQTHIGTKSRYVTPIADHRLSLTRYFTLAKPLSESDDVVYVEENPEGCVMDERCRVIKMGGELIYYDNYTTDYPYKFTGCKRGHFDTNVTPHEIGTIGGLLDISEYGAYSIYINQNSSLQDEVAQKLADIYNAGFEYVYFDGSEGASIPYEIYIPLAQYRVYNKLINEPLYCEGAAKAHFSWHMLSGGNAFDVFPTDVFKEKIVQFPFEEAERMKNDFTRLNFGWWAFYDDTQPDVYEFGTSRAAAWDCPVTLQSNVEKFKTHPRLSDIFEVVRRWEDVRAKKWLTEEQKEELKNPNLEHILIINENNEYELLRYEEIKLSDELKKSVSAFIFERNKKTCVVCWHKTGNAKLSLPITDENTGYFDEIGGKETTYEKNNDSIIIPLDKRRYLVSSLKKEELTEAFKKAVIL